MIKKGIIISTFAFTIGNIVWPFFENPKIFYIPLAILLWLFYLNIRRNEKSRLLRLFFLYGLLLASGNIVKQVFYSETIKQLNDYVWGGFVTLWLIITLLLKWETLNKPYGMK